MKIGQTVVVQAQDATTNPPAPESTGVMQVFFSEFEKLHQPTFELDQGNRLSYHEVAARTTAILKALDNKNFKLEKVDEIPLAAILAVHSRDYIEFLKSTAKLTDVVIPDVYYKDPNPIPMRKLAPKYAVGYYSLDDGAPITPDTWKAVAYSASSAYAAAQHVEGGEKVAYALCRPPGHHAGAALCGGFCYLNNAAIAARYLTAKSKKVLLLDLDFHHGNGTQSITYNDPSIYYCSLHGDPDTHYPYFTGRPDERGTGAGEGFNLNVPLPTGTKGPAYKAALLRALETVHKNFKPDYLIVSIGFDTLGHDPEGDFELTFDDLANNAEILASLRLPTVVVQEGGYVLKNLGDAAVHFLSPFEH